MAGRADAAGGLVGAAADDGTLVAAGADGGHALCRPGGNTGADRARASVAGCSAPRQRAAPVSPDACLSRRCR